MLCVRVDGRLLVDEDVAGFCVCRRGSSARQRAISERALQIGILEDRRT